jgi:hypothetical protein
LVDSQFPNPIATELVIAEVSTLNSVDTLEHLDFRNGVAQLFQPTLKGITFVFAKVVPDSEYKQLSSKNDKVQAALKLLPLPIPPLH